VLMQELGRNFNDLHASPPRPDSRGVSGSGGVSDGVDGGSTTSAIPMDQEVRANLKGAQTSS